MSLAPGSRIGPYEILSPLGAGGMGEVWLTRDTRLGRDVAIKALPEAFAHDRDRLARFEREARLLASLKHPNIAAIYGLEEADGERYLVLEYVAGPTLADRLASGALPLDETLEVALQIASGVEAAHESGVVHRDLKPANVKLTPAGEVKVLDFGLAKSDTGSGNSSGLDLSNSPTVAHQPATSAGMILGTAAYMSPEQARGRPVDRRTDIWSFGCVLYECLTGHPLHMGETVSDLIAHILKGEPDWKALPRETPPRLRELLERCLQKDPRERLRDIGDARIELAHIRTHLQSGDRGAAAGASAQSDNARAGTARVAWGIAGAAALVAALVLLAPRLVRAPAPVRAQFTVTMPYGHEFLGFNAAAAIAPDGGTIAFIATDSTGTSRIWLRPLDDRTGRVLEGTENALELFWSPDSRALGFFADGKLCTVPVKGGRRQVLADAPSSRGGAWSTKGTILFAPIASGPLMRVPAEGGEVVVEARPDSSRRETALRYPTFLPDGEHYTYLSLPRREGGEHMAVLGKLGEAGKRDLFSSVSAPVYDGSGGLLFTHRGQLMRQPCDARGNLKGKPVRLGESPQARGHDGQNVVTVSNNGVLLHLTPQPDTRLTWVDRTGAVTQVLPLPPAQYGYVDVSPDGRRAILERGTDVSTTDLVMVDLERGTTSRFVTANELVGPSDAHWSRDGSQVSFGALEHGTKDLYLRPSDGGEIQMVHRSPALFKNVYSWTPGDQGLVFEQPDARSGWDIYMLPLSGTRTPVPIAKTDVNEFGGWLSPDGRWLAFMCDETGRAEIYVMPFPGGGARYQVTTTGAAACAWRKDGRELMILTPEGLLRSVEVDPGPPFRSTTPRTLFRLPRGTVDVDASPDLQRFLVVAPQPGAEPLELVVKMGWLGR
jgi:Tol biopolymer transport system component